jgi:altronate dehydratase
MNNHVVAKCCKMMNLYRKVMKTRKKPRYEDPSPHGKKQKGMKTWIKKNHCTHFNKGGHQQATYWTLHLELCPKKDKANQL